MEREKEWIVLSQEEAKRVLAVGEMARDVKGALMVVLVVVVVEEGRYKWVVSPV